MILSVVMSCYNAEQTMRAAIDSILAQTYGDFSFIIVNDGSTDKTLQILEEYASKDSRITIINNEVNLKLSASLNRGIRATNTKYIARMDADDVALPTRFEKQITYLQSNPNIDILGTAIQLITTSGKNIGIGSRPMDHSSIINQIYSKPPLYHPTIMLKKSVYDQHGYYDPNVPWAEDMDLWYRIYDKVTFANLQEPLLLYTVKDRLSFSNVKTVATVKYKNLKARNLLLRQSPQLLKDIFIYTKSMVSAH